MRKLGSSREFALVFFWRRRWLHESNPVEIGDGFKELEELPCKLLLEDNNAVFNLCCRLFSAYERKAFIEGLQYGAHLISELQRE